MSRLIPSILMMGSGACLVGSLFWITTEAYNPASAGFFLGAALLLAFLSKWIRKEQMDERA